MSRRVALILCLSTLTALVLGALAQDTRAQDTTEPPVPAQPTTPACPAATFHPQLLTPPAERTPRDAALVVGLFEGGTFTALPAVSLERGRRTTALIPELIAPGLYRLRPDARRIWGRWNLTGVPGAPPLLFGRPGVGAAPVRPRLDRVERYLVASGQGTSMEVRGHFHFPIPAGVIAVVTFWGDDARPDGFARVTPSLRETVLYQQRGACPRLLPGASPPPEAGNVRVAFVGRYGQLGEISEPVALGR